MGRRSDPARARGERRGWRAVTAVLALGAALAGCRIEATPPRGDPGQEAADFHEQVAEILSESARAWNAGDLDGFMRWYRADGPTTYIGSTGLIHGRDAIRGRYAPLFGSGASRDSLRFENLETRPIGPGLGLATANYVLYRGESTTAYGIFTLVVQEMPDGWRIVHDHSSALEQ